MNTGTLNVNILLLGTGVWDMVVDLSVLELGAVSDATSTMELTFFANDGTGQTISFAKVSNKQGAFQHHTRRWTQMVTSEFDYSINRVRVLGLGTGLNLARIYIQATRLF
jgi:hypothetical protein